MDTLTYSALHLGNKRLLQFLEEKFVVILLKLFFCAFTFPKVTIDNDLLPLFGISR